MDVGCSASSRSRSPDDRADYFAAGVKLVWYLYPKTKSAVAYTSPTRKKEVAPTGSLDGGKVLPGFSLPLADVFAPPRRPKRLP